MSELQRRQAEIIEAIERGNQKIIKKYETKYKLIDHEQDLKEIVEAMADNGLVTDDNNKEWITTECKFCAMYETPQTMFPHLIDCPVVKAQKLLNEIWKEG